MKLSISNVITIDLEAFREVRLSYNFQCLVNVRLALRNNQNHSISVQRICISFVVHFNQSQSNINQFWKVLIYFLIKDSSFPCSAINSRVVILLIPVIQLLPFNLVL